jgi:hypothetical protein
VTAQTNAATAGDAQLVGAPGRPARPVESEQGERDAESVLSLTLGAGPGQSKEDCMASTRPSARPVRFADPARNAAYWARIDRIAAAAPPLTADQRARIRAAFFQPAAREAA